MQEFLYRCLAGVHGLSTGALGSCQSTVELLVPFVTGYIGGRISGVLLASVASAEITSFLRDLRGSESYSVGAEGVELTTFYSLTGCMSTGDPRRVR